MINTDCVKVRALDECVKYQDSSQYSREINIKVQVELMLKVSNSVMYYTRLKVLSNIKVIND